MLSNTVEEILFTQRQCSRYTSSHLSSHSFTKTLLLNLQISLFSYFHSPLQKFNQCLEKVISFKHAKFFKNNTLCFMLLYSISSDITVLQRTLVKLLLCYSKSHKVTEFSCYKMNFKQKIFNFYELLTFCDLNFVSKPIIYLGGTCITYIY